MEPTAAVTAPAHVSAQHQNLLHFVASVTWSDEQMQSTRTGGAVDDAAQSDRSLDH
jgi:SRSO17 transposase